jgi:hypothetical protein
MYFMTRHNRIYIWAAGISAAHRYFITAVFVGALWGTWFFCCYARHNAKISAQRQEIASLHTQKTQQQCLAQACTQEQSKIAELQAQLAPYSEFLESAQPLERTQARMLDIINFTKKAGLSLISCSMGSVQDGQTINLTVTGTLAALYSFLATVRDSKKAIQCSRSQLEREQDGQYRMTTEFYIVTILYSHY